MKKPSKWLYNEGEKGFFNLFGDSDITKDFNSSRVNYL